MATKRRSQRMLHVPIPKMVHEIVQDRLKAATAFKQAIQEARAGRCIPGVAYLEQGSLHMGAAGGLLYLWDKLSPTGKEGAGWPGRGDDRWIRLRQLQTDAALAIVGCVRNPPKN